MKHFVIYILILFLMPLVLMAQTQQQGEKKEEVKTPPPAARQNDNQRAKANEALKNAPVKRTFVDADGDGIDDRTASRKNIKQERPRADMKKIDRHRQHDRFVDADGDGINDNRCKGMGLGHNKGRFKRHWKK